MFTLSGVVFVLTRKATCYSVKIYPKCDPPRKRSEPRSFAPLEKLRRNHRSYV